MPTLRHMRTTILLPDALYAAAKQRAHEQQRTVTSLIEQALREQLATREPDRAFRVEPYRGRGVQPGVNLNDSADLLARMGD